MKLASRLTMPLLAALMAAGLPAQAQSGPQRAAVAFGALALHGPDGERSLGLLGAAQITIAADSSRRFAFEVGLQALALTGVYLDLRSGPSPASPMWHFRALGSRPVAPDLYVTAGLGGYGPAGRAAQPHTLVLGLDAGLGFRLSSRAAIEARYVHLRSDRLVSWALPLSLVVGL